jgi:transcriptional regulator with XRE-family HTH domain
MEHTIGARLRKLRRLRGWTLKQAAQEANISVSYLSDVERDRTLPALRTLANIGTIYNITLAGLVIGIDLADWQKGD